MERNEGLIERSWVAGVKSVEVIVSQIFIQMFTMLIQILLALVIVIFAFKVRNILFCPLLK